MLYDVVKEKAPTKPNNEFTALLWVTPYFILLLDLIHIYILVRLFKNLYTLYQGTVKKYFMKMIYILNILTLCSTTHLKHKYMLCTGIPYTNSNTVTVTSNLSSCVVYGSSI